MNKREIWTIPNMITFYRLLMSPVILYFTVSGKEKLFVVFIVINMVSDFLDGYIARKFHMETNIGAKIDALADNFTFVLAIIGIFIFRMDELKPYLVGFFIYIGMAVLPQIVSLIKFRSFPSFHLYIYKYSGYVQLAFFICIFTIGIYPPLFYLMVIWMILGGIEHITIQMIIPEMRSNVRGLYWVLKERRANKQKPS